jgi:hypothetical protein
MAIRIGTNLSENEVDVFWLFAFVFSTSVTHSQDDLQSAADYLLGKRHAKAPPPQRPQEAPAPTLDDDQPTVDASMLSFKVCVPSRFLKTKMFWKCFSQGTVVVEC